LSGTALVAAQDLATAACGLLNAGYFSRYWWRRGWRARRLAAAAMALVSAAAVVEAAFSQGLFWAQHGGSPLGEPSPGAWALVRLPLFVATLFISALVIRRMRS
jgi:hypothetical protein